MRLLLSSSLPLLLLALASLGLTQEAAIKYSRDDFPSDFVFGAGTSAYQYEGAVAEDGRSPSTWDTFTHAGNMPNKSTGDVASDGYHKYKEDVKLMSELGLEAYRFSISWSRLLPNGRGAVNPKGLEYYNGLINELIERGIQPHITLHHVELPQVLEDEYGGWLSPKIIEDMKEYADVCFREFGDRVSHWTTINEPNILTLLSYEFGLTPPRRCSFPFRPFNCSAGNSSVEPYIAMHNVLLAHAAVVRLYRTKYQILPTGINIYPPGLRNLLRYLKQEYGNPPIYIYENGYEGVKHILNDTDRIDYLDRYIRSTLDAIRDGSNVRGYFVWSFLDVFELATGYESSYGLYYVDFSNVERKRQPKLSARWYSNFLANKNGIRLKQRSGIQRVYNQ
ncbi:uncharacterized protein A4U43_C04F20900 [Asparagus officinalis]|uniref:Beta-glucosidase n=1 Tax=Asparagus officinalis TaxID=4686 RepID=A0A5P1F7F3_ASPOF|nr:uncharacterized protein A4U43_C04F20900 [Asparagus officinalis]